MANEFALNLQDASLNPATWALPTQVGESNGKKSAAVDLGADTFKIALYTGTATLNETTGSYVALNEVANGNGYTTGGQTLTVTVAPTVSSGGTVAYLSFANVTWNPASFTCRGALIYKYDGATNPSVCVLDFGADKTATNTFQVQFPAATSSSAIIRIA